MKVFAIISSAIVLTAMALFPLAADKYVSGEVIEVTNKVNTALKKQLDGTSIKYSDVSYSIFSDLVTIENVTISNKLAEIKANKVQFNPIQSSSTEENPIKYLESETSLIVSGGTLRIKSSAITDDMKSKVDLLTGNDNKIDFSIKASRLYVENKRAFEYRYEHYIENLGESRLSFDEAEIDFDSVESLSPTEINKYAVQNGKITNISMSLQLQNVRKFGDTFFQVDQYIQDDKDFLAEIDKATKKIEQNEAMAGFATVIKDLGTSYVTEKEIVLTLSTKKEITHKEVLNIFVLLQSKQHSLPDIFSYLGVEVSSKVIY
jgi:ABC-type amino acid transport substrate-binding protein